MLLCIGWKYASTNKFFGDSAKLNIIVANEAVYPEILS